MGSRGIGEESLTVEHIELVHAIGQQLVLDLALDAGAGHNGLEVNA